MIDCRQLGVETLFLGFNQRKCAAGGRAPASVPETWSTAARTAGRPNGVVRCSGGSADPLSGDRVHTAIIGGDPLFREGLRRIFEGTRYEIGALARSLDDVLQHAGGLDLAVLLEFPAGSPRFLDSLAAFRQRWPGARVVVIVENLPGQLIAALKAGVHGYLARHISAEALLRFLSLILLGQRIFSTKSLDFAKDFETPIQVPAQKPLAGRIHQDALTERERALLAFLVEGHSNKVIARRLGIAEATVKAQMARLFGKIGAANRTQAAVLAWAADRAPQLRSARALEQHDLDRAS